MKIQVLDLSKSSCNQPGFIDAVVFYLELNQPLDSYSFEVCRLEGIPSDAGCPIVCPVHIPVSDCVGVFVPGTITPKSHLCPLPFNVTAELFTVCVQR